MLLFVLVFVLLLSFLNHSQVIQSGGGDVHHMFWTGGFDSTFMICQAIIDRGLTVQPYYITADIDDCPSCNFKRNNRMQEIRAMDRVRLLLNDKYPHLKDRLRTTIHVSTVSDNYAVTDQFHKMRLHNSNRRYNQYEAMCRYALHNGIKMSIGTVGIIGEGTGSDLPTDRWGTYLRTNLHNFGLSDGPARNLLFPIAYLTKRQMLDIAKNNGYDDLVSQSWSCWFPKGTSGQPCGQCPMCRDRIITQLT
jgi:hypothetical protein